MKKSSISVLFIAMVMLQPFQPQAFAFEDAIIAIVDDELITMKDLSDYMNAVYIQLKTEGTYSEAEIQKIMGSAGKDSINRLIEDRLILNAANEKGFEVRREVIDEKINNIRKKYPSEKDFLAALTSQGLTLSDLRERLTGQLKSQYFIDSEIKASIQINPQQVTDYFEQHPEQFIQPRSAKINSMFTPSGDDKEEAFQKASQALEVLKSGKTFDQAAKDFSATASVSTIIKGQMRPEIEEKIFALGDNEFTGPIEASGGYFIFQMIKKYPEKKVTLDDAKDKITKRLFAEKMKEKLDQWFEETKAKTFIEIKKP